MGISYKEVEKTALYIKFISLFSQNMCISLDTWQWFTSYCNAVIRHLNIAHLGAPEATESLWMQTYFSDKPSSALSYVQRGNITAFLGRMLRKRSTVNEQFLKQATLFTNISTSPSTHHVTLGIPSIIRIHRPWRTNNTRFVVSLGAAGLSFG